mmetsp:Transcript_103743/g.206219  ORF Transcript_103743/g.206219 Transcript_103743/m.206219 type:complete len:193 (-) Transcript_103743:166-744(-)
MWLIGAQGARRRHCGSRFLVALLLLGLVHRMALPRSCFMLSQPETSTISQAVQRRHMFAVGGAHAAALLIAAVEDPRQPVSAALAAEKPPPPPDALMVTGYEGAREDVNGRWSILFGKFLNGKAVYKKDGANKAYLVLNDCGKFQMGGAASGQCDAGFAVKSEDGWAVDGKGAPEMKMKPYVPSYSKDRDLL